MQDVRKMLNKVPKPETMEDLIEGINILMDEGARPEVYVELFQNYKNSDWERFCSWDPYRYTRNLVEEVEGKYSLILLCWPEANASAIHDHPNSDCIMKCMKNQIKETRYNWPTKKKTKMSITGVTTATEGDVIHINDDMGLHRVENPSTSERCVSLHFYFPCIHECLIFDEDSGKARSVKMTYTTVRGKKLDPREKIALANQVSESSLKGTAF